MGLEEPRPLRVDLARGHPLPGPGIGLTQARVADHTQLQLTGQPQLTGDDRGGLRRPRQIARRHDRELARPSSEASASPDRLRLAPPEVGERRIGDALPALHGVPFALAVPDEQQRTLRTVHPGRGYWCRYAADRGNRAPLRVRPSDRWHRPGRAARAHGRRSARRGSRALRRSLRRRARNLPDLGQRGVGRRPDRHRPPRRSSDSSPRFWRIMVTPDDPTTLSLEELRDVRARLQHEDDVVSYARAGRAGPPRPRPCRVTSPRAG